MYLTGGEMGWKCAVGVNCRIPHAQSVVLFSPDARHTDVPMSCCPPTDDLKLSAV